MNDQLSIITLISFEWFHFRSPGDEKILSLKVSLDMSRGEALCSNALRTENCASCQPTYNDYVCTCVGENHPRPGGKCPRKLFSFFSFRGPWLG